MGMNDQLLRDCSAARSEFGFGKRSASFGQVVQHVQLSGAAALTVRHHPCPCRVRDELVNPPTGSPRSLPAGEERSSEDSDQDHKSRGGEEISCN